MAIGNDCFSQILWTNLTGVTSSQSKLDNYNKNLLNIQPIKNNNSIKPFSNKWKNEEHPNMDSNDKHVLEEDLAQHELAQVQRPVDHYEHELQDQHYQKRDRHFVLFQIRLHASVALMSLIIKQRISLICKDGGYVQIGRYNIKWHAIPGMPIKVKKWTIGLSYNDSDDYTNGPKVKWF